MKALIILLMIAIPSFSFACTNFSGSFITSQGAQYSLMQSTCESMDMLDGQTLTTIHFNEKEQLIYNFDLQDGDEIVGRQKVFITSKLAEEKWVYKEKVVKTYINGKTIVENSWSEVFLNENSDLKTIVHRQDGTIEAYIDLRIRPMAISIRK